MQHFAAAHIIITQIMEGKDIDYFFDLDIIIIPYHAHRGILRITVTDRNSCLIKLCMQFFLKIGHDQPSFRL